MIVQQHKIEGKDATFAFLMNDLKPAPSVDEAELVKVVFDDGSGSIWLRVAATKDGNGTANA